MTYVYIISNTLNIPLSSLNKYNYLIPNWINKQTNENIKNSSIAYLTVVYIIKKLFYIDKKILFNKNKLGKPLIDNCNNIFFNISHTENYVACIVSDSYDVGIDIENIKHANKNIIKKYYSEYEVKYIYDDMHNIDYRFTKIWTMKECFVKMIGSGITSTFKYLDTKKLNYNSSYFFKTKFDEKTVCSFCMNGKDIIMYKYYDSETVLRNLENDFRS